jgi:hypothetical protein
MTSLDTCLESTSFVKRLGFRCFKALPHSFEQVSALCKGQQCESLCLLGAVSGQCVCFRGSSVSEIGYKAAVTRRGAARGLSGCLTVTRRGAARGLSGRLNADSCADEASPTARVLTRWDVVYNKV